PPHLVDVLAHPMPDVQQRPRVVHADRGDGRHPRHAEQQRQRQRALMERGEHQRLVDLQVDQAVHQLLHRPPGDRPRLGVDPPGMGDHHVVHPRQQPPGVPPPPPAQQPHPPPPAPPRPPPQPPAPRRPPPSPPPAASPAPPRPPPPGPPARPAARRPCCPAWP